MSESYAIGNAYNGVPALPKSVLEGINKTITRGMVKLGYAPSSRVEFPITETSHPRHLDMPANSNSIKGVDFVSTANNPKRWAESAELTGKYGGRSPQDDDNGYKFGGWKAAGEKYGPNYFEAVKPKIGYGIIISLGDKQAEFDPRDTQLSKYTTATHYDGPINDFGKSFAKAHNVETSLNSHLRKRIPQEVLEDLRSDGFKPKDIGYIGVNVGPEGIIYAVGKAKDGRKILIAADDTGAKILQLAHHLGIDPDLVRTYALNEELAHIWMDSIERREKGVSLIAEERRVKSYLHKEYLKRKNSSAGNLKLQEDYGDLEDMAGNWDIPTIKRRYKGEGLFAKGLENIVDNETVDIVRGKDGNSYAIVGVGDKVYITKLNSKDKKYDRDENSPEERVDPSSIKSMSDALANKDMEETAEAPAE